MTVGELNCRVVLDDPTKVHCGSHDAVKGNVRMSFTSSSKDEVNAPELFGPAKITVTLHGRLKTKIRQQKGTNGKETYRSRVPILMRQWVVHDGPIRVAHRDSADLAFEMRFPQRIAAQFAQTGWAGRFKYDPGAGWNANPDQPLPPSMTFAHSGFWSGNDGEAHVQYNVALDVRMPDIDVKIRTPDWGLWPALQYERARVVGRPSPDHVREQNGSWLVKDRALDGGGSGKGGEKPEPSSLRERLKLTHRPQCRFATRTSAQTHVHRFAPIVAAVRVQPVDDATRTTEALPGGDDIKMLRASATVEQLVRLRTEPKYFSEKSYAHEATMFREELTAAGGDFANGDDAFSERDDWTKTLVFRRLSARVPSTVSTVCITNTYVLRLKCDVNIAGKTYSVEQKLPLTVHPPLGRSEGIATTSSTAAAPTADELSLLPAYQEPTDVAPPAYAYPADGAKGAGASDCQGPSRLL